MRRSTSAGRRVAVPAPFAAATGRVEGQQQPRGWRFDRSSSCPAGRLAAWPLVAALFSGCGGDAAPGSAAAPADALLESSSVRRLGAADLAIAVGEYMPPLERGTLEIAAPAGWDWKRPTSSQQLVGFVPLGGASINTLPRVLLSVEEDASFPDVANEAGLEAFARGLAERLSGEKLAEPVQALILAEHPCAAYVRYGRSGEALVRQQVVMLPRGGRIWTIRLESFDRLFPKYRDAAFAVAASMRFVEPVEAAAPEAAVGDPAPAG